MPTVFGGFKTLIYFWFQVLSDKYQPTKMNTKKTTKLSIEEIRKLNADKQVIINSQTVVNK